jgi:autotransporter-associated beta strand protein
LLTLALLFVISGPLRAANVTWNNMTGNFLWDLTDPNWSTGLWNNANGDGAIFGATGAGAITVTEPINVNSLNFTANGYTLDGPGPLNLVNGNSSLGTGFISVGDTFTARINTAINTSVGLFKLGAGVLELGGPVTFSGPGTTFLQNGLLRVDVIAAGISESNSPGGTLRVLNTNVFAPTTRVGINNGLIDFGANDQTLASVVFNNQSDAVPWNPAINAAGAGLIGTGTLRVTGDINVIGQSFGNDGANTIANNLNLGGGTQVIRTSQGGQSLLWGALQLTGTLSNGSLLTTESLNGVNGFSVAADGLSLLGNNTYAGSTTINGGYNIASGTNASTSILVSGNNGPPGGGNNLTLFGANGSFLSANTIQLYSGGTLILDNTFADGNISGTAPIAAAQNNNRLSDGAEIQMRDGNFTIKGLSTATASEAIGKITIQGGHNIITLTPAGAGGTVTLNVAGDLTMTSRSTLQIASTTIGAASKLFVNGALPTPDPTGILPRVVGTNDFLTYNATTGFTPYTGYAPDFTSPGTNVAVTAAASVPTSIDVNAIKSTGSFVTTIAAGQTLGVTSGMLLNTSGTRTYTGGTIAFAGTPGAFFGNNTVNSAITGSNGLLNATGTLTLAGDLSGLSGTITQDGLNGTTNLNTNTFAGAIEVRGGFFSLGASQTLAGQGAITLGVPANDAHLVSAPASLSFSAAGANAVIARDIIIDNGGLDAAGQRLDSATLPASLLPLSNSTGSQTLSGNITINSPVRLQGGGAGGTGATIFSGNISGTSFMQIINGREVFSGDVSNAGGFYLGRQGNKTEVTFNGTTSGSVPLILSGGNGNTTSYAPGSLPTGTITTDITDPSSVPYLVPWADSTINNAIHLDGVVYNTATGGIFAGSGSIGADVETGISAAWAGPVSGLGGLIKKGAGILTLGNANNTYTGSTAVNAGTLLVQGANASASTTVANTGTLGGNGSLSGPVTVDTGGTISPGDSIGTFSTGALTLSGTFLAEIDLNNGGPASADLLNLTGSFNISGGILMLSLGNLPANFAGGTFILVANDGADGINGTFSDITGLPTGYSATVDYAFTGTDSLGRIGDGNDLAIHLIPEPQSIALLLLGSLAVLGLRRRRC